MNERHEPSVDADFETFSSRIASSVAEWTPAHRAAFAALVAGRHQRELGEDRDMRVAPASATPREMSAVIWSIADGKPLDEATLAAFLSTLREVSTLVDPDRVKAFDVYRAIGVLEEALRCCAGTPETGPLELAVAALATRAGASPNDRAEIGPKLRTAWALPAVQAEARWLSVVVGALSMLRAIDAVAARTLRCSLADVPVRVVTLTVAGKALVLIGVDDNRRFRAEVDGERRPIRHRRFADERGSGDCAWTVDTTADIAPLLRCLDGNAEQKATDRTTVLSLIIPGAHFRQYEWAEVTLSFAPDGAVQIDMGSGSRDESYY